MFPVRNRRPYPAVQLRGELGLKLTDGAVAVVPLDKDLGGQGRTPPQLLQIVHLSRRREDASRVTLLPGLSEMEGVWGCESFYAKLRNVSGKLGQVGPYVCSRKVTGKQDCRVHPRRCPEQSQENLEKA